MSDYRRYVKTIYLAVHRAIDLLRGRVYIEDRESINLV